MVPEAITPLQRMQMMGEAPTFQNIADTVTKGLNQTVQNIPQPNTAGNIFTRILAALGKIIIGFTCGIGIILIICLVVATIAATVGLIVYYVSGSSSFPSWISGVQSAWWLIRFIWAMLGAIITIGLPIYIIYRLAFCKNWRPASRTVIKLAFVWVVGIILASTNFNKLEKYNDEKDIKVSIEKAIDTAEDDDDENTDIEDSIASDITLQNQDSIITADSVTSVKTSKTGSSK